jgi:hypothetical protein
VFGLLAHAVLNPLYDFLVMFNWPTGAGRIAETVQPGWQNNDATC